MCQPLMIPRPELPVRVDAPHRAVLLGALVAIGELHVVPPVAAAVSPGAPPPPPQLVVNHIGLPRTVRTLVHEENISRSNAYARAYRAYLERFSDLVLACATPEALRALGQPQPSCTPAAEPGLELDGDEDLRWDFDARVAREDHSAVTHKLHAKNFRFRESG